MNALSLFKGPLGWFTAIWIALIIIVFIIALFRLRRIRGIIIDCDSIIYPAEEKILNNTPVGQLLLSVIKSPSIDFTEDTLNVSSVAARYKLNLRMIQAVPGILTSLGILGTFIGLSAAVAGFDSSSSDAISKSITPLLAGMGTAFITSVTGMLASTFFLWRERTRYNALCNAIDSLCERTDRAYHQSFHDNLSNVFDEKVTPIMSEISRKLENPAQAIVDNLTEEFKNMANNLSSILTDKVNDRMNELIKQFILATDSIKEIPETIDIATTNLLKSSNESVAAQKKATTEFINQIESLKSIEEVYSNTLEQITSANSDLADAKSNIALLTSKISSAAQSIESASSGIVESNEKMLSDFEEIYKLNRDVTEQVKDYSERIKGIEGGLSGVFKEIENGLTKYASTSAQNMQKLLNVFTDSVTNACQNISNATAPLHETIGGILKALDRTEKSAQALLKRVESLPQHKE